MSMYIVQGLKVLLEVVILFLEVQVFVAECRLRPSKKKLSGLSIYPTGTRQIDSSNCVNLCLPSSNLLKLHFTDVHYS